MVIKDREADIASKVENCPRLEIRNVVSRPKRVPKDIHVTCPWAHVNRELQPAHSKSLNRAPMAFFNGVPSNGGPKITERPGAAQKLQGSCNHSESLALIVPD